MLSSISAFSGKLKGARKMVHKHGKSTALNCNAGSRWPLSAIIWTLAVWIMLLQAYNILTPKSPEPKPQSQSHQLSAYREYEDIDDRGFQVKQMGKKFPAPSGKTKTKKHSIVDDFLDVTSQRRSLYFPYRIFAIDPSKYDVDKYFLFPGQTWLDTDGKPIQAHGGGILYDEETQTFYWYGENKDGKTYHMIKKGTARVDIIGVNCYSSPDLWTWKNEGIVLPSEKSNKTHDLYVTNVLERPKVIYNARTKEYVMWMHIDNGNYSKASVGVAVSTSPVGPFHYMGSKRPHGFDSRDMTIFKDDDNGEAFIVYSSEDNAVLHIGGLTDDYRDVTHTFTRVLVGEHREAPAVFKHEGLYYMITSGCTGWAPNAALAHAAESMLGSWVTLGNPCVGGNEDFRSTTFFSQGTFVLPLPGVSDTYIFMADRWNPADLRDSRYVWLPLIIDGPADEPVENDFEFPIWSRFSIYWHKKWRLPLSNQIAK